VLVAFSAALTAYSSRPALLLSRLITLLHTSDFLLTAVLLFFVGLIVFMGRRWEQYEFGIAFGLGVNAAALLATFAIFSKFVPLHGILRELPVFGEDAASVIWLVTFLRPERSKAIPAESITPEVLEEARKWKETLKGSLSRNKNSD